jgi:hypothetical protein
MSSKKPKQPLTIDLNRPHTCEFCQRSFAKESSLFSHVCEAKRRHQTQNVSYVKKGFLAWKMFYQSNTPTQTVCKKTYQEFSTSSLYAAFVKFGSWCEENQIQEFESLVIYLLANNVKIDYWCDLNTYKVYLQGLILEENSEQAVARTLETIKRWATDSNHPWQQFFLKIHPNIAVGWITQGRISPWVLYNCDSAVGFLERCTPEQLNIIQDFASIRKWKVRFLRNKETADNIKLILQEAGL